MFYNFQIKTQSTSHLQIPVVFMYNQLRCVRFTLPSYSDVDLYNSVLYTDFIELFTPVRKTLQWKTIMILRWYL